MANSSTKTRAVKCQRCQRTFRTAAAAAVTCQECQRMASSPPTRPSLNSRQTSHSADNVSIPSAYLQLLDSRIADLEHAAEASRPSDQSMPTADGTDKPARPGSLRARSITPYMNDATRSKDQKTSPRQSKASSVIMERFLSDASEPEVV